MLVMGELPPVQTWWVMTNGPQSIKKLWEFIVLSNPTIGLGTFASQQVLDLLVNGPSKSKDSAFKGNVTKQKQVIEQVSRSVHADSVSISNTKVDALLGGTSSVEVKTGVTPHHVIPPTPRSVDSQGNTVTDVVVAGISTTSALLLGNPLAAASLIAEALRNAFTATVVPGTNVNMGFLSPLGLMRDNRPKLIKPLDKLKLEGDGADSSQAIINATALDAIIKKANGMGVNLAIPMVGSYYIVSYADLINKLTKAIEPEAVAKSTGIPTTHRVLAEYWKSNKPTMTFEQFIKANQGVLQTLTFTRTDAGTLSPSTTLTR